MSRWLDHSYILAMLIFGTYSQLIIRWKVSLAGELPDVLEGKIIFVLKLLINPWVISALVSTFLGGVSWMLAMTKFEISYAYPWVSLNFIIMLLSGVLIFGESFSLYKVIGTVLIMAGIIVLAKNS